jgi:hypothetical protein
MAFAMAAATLRRSTATGGPTVGTCIVAEIWTPRDSFDDGGTRRPRRRQERPIRTRTAESRNRAKAQGKHMGRPPSLTRPNRKRQSDGARRA